MERSRLDYHLPKDRIAQRPAPRRQDARLLYLPGEGSLSHHTVGDLPSLLEPGDLLVLNDTRVLAARIHARRATGGKVKLLFLRELEDGTGEFMATARGRLEPGEVLHLRDGSVQLFVAGRTPEGRLLATPRGGGWDAVLAAGRPPLPPYIKRPFEDDDLLAEDRERYQTVFAGPEGSVAAPTAGLHFDAALLDALHARGMRTAFVTLHVGPGTFRPIEAEGLADHTMEVELCDVGEETIAAIAEARSLGRRVVAVGTTVVRTLESAVTDRGLEAGPRETNLFIYPPYRFRVVDALLTNFHLPRSTLLALVAALGGVGRVLAAYEEAVQEGYRFYSYGDAMLLTGAGPMDGTTAIG